MRTTNRRRTDEIFLGRREEQDRYRDALRQLLQQEHLVGRVRDWLTDQQVEAVPFVFLIYGEGGMGKTRLAGRLREITLTEQPFKDHFRVIMLDWEHRRELDTKLVARDSVSPETVFEHIYAVFRDEGFGRQFDSYEKAVKARAQAETKVAQAVNRVSEAGDRYGPLRELGAKGLAVLLRTGVPAAAALPDDVTAEAFESVLEGGATALAATREKATTLVRSVLDPDEFDLFTLPHETLARRLGDGVHLSSANKPIMLIIDTYEIADRADIWLREVIRRAGPRVVWVVAGRDNLADSRRFGQHYFTGYRADFSSDRLRVFPLGEFSVGDVGAYFADRVPQRPINAETAEAIHRATLGVPLAVREAAAIWQAGAGLEDIVSDVPPRAPREQIVKVMTERFLLHCFDDPAHPDDRARLYALALAYRAEPSLLAAVLEMEDLEEGLSDLERRHSFVFVEQMKLHDSVTAFVREYLMLPVRRQSRAVRSIHERAMECLQQQRSALEARMPSLELRVADERWRYATLGLVHHALWIDEDLGWSVLIPSLIGGLAYDRSLAGALVEAVESLEATLSQTGKRRLAILQNGLGVGAT